jgi:hypothetical protein
MTPLFERPCHQSGYCYLKCWNQWPISRYFHQAPWWAKITWTLKWIKHHWFSKYGLECCTSDLNLVELGFMSKILFTLKFMHALQSYCFQAICIFCFSKLVHLWPIYVLLLAYTPNLSIIKFSRVSKSFSDKNNRTCPFPLPNISILRPGNF